MDDLNNLFGKNKLLSKIKRQLNRGLRPEQALIVADKARKKAIYNQYLLKPNEEQGQCNEETKDYKVEARDEKIRQEYKTDPINYLDKRSQIIGGTKSTLKCKQI